MAGGQATRENDLGSGSPSEHRREMKARTALFLLALVAATNGCGYALVGTGQSALPENIKTVYVATFTNDTTVVGVQQKTNDAVIRELPARRRLTPVSDRTKADAELEGRITSYGLNAVRF